MKMDASAMHMKCIICVAWMLGAVIKCAHLLEMCTGSAQ